MKSKLFIFKATDDSNSAISIKWILNKAVSKDFYRTIQNSPNYNFLKDHHNLSKSNFEIKSYSEFISGYLAACTSITLLFPLNKIIFRQILHGISLKEACKQIKSDGMGNFYRGLLPPLLQKSTSYSIMFGSQNEYFILLNRYCDHSNLSLIKSMNPTYRNIITTGISGAMAGLTEAALCPFERIQSVLQMKQFHERFKNSLDAFQDIKRNHGFKELYRGLSVICLRNSLSNAIFFTMRTPLKSLFPKPKNKFQNYFFDFINGGVLGAFISTLTYPFNIIKSHMQAKVGGEFYGIIYTFKEVYYVRDRSLILLFKGVGSNFTRALLAWGITNASYEFCLGKLKIEI